MSFKFTRKLRLGMNPRHRVALYSRIGLILAFFAIIGGVVAEPLLRPLWPPRLTVARPIKTILQRPLHHTLPSATWAGMRGEGSSLALASYLRMNSAATVLLIEPDTDLRNMLCAVLTGAGYAVVAYGDGEEALADLKDTCAFDLLVTEVRLSNLDGWQLARDARRLCPGLPVVFIPAHDKSRSMRGRRSFVLPKPFGVRAFLIAIQIMASPLVTYH